MASRIALTSRLGCPRRPSGPRGAGGRSVGRKLLRVARDGRDVLLVELREGAPELHLGARGRDLRGARVPSGTYFYRMHTPTFQTVRKMVLLR